MSIILMAILFIVVFLGGIALGFVTRKLLVDRSEYDGAVIVTKDNDKVLYSLELHEDPETIQHKNELVFKVIIPKESPTRE